MNDDTIKQVIVVRKDLKMQRGKEIAQGSHASMAFMAERLRFEGYEGGNDDDGLGTGVFTPTEVEWLYNGRFTKITLQVNSLKELDDVYTAATRAGLEVHTITDSGLTVFHGVPTKTCLAIGPDYSSKIDPITANLKLY